MIRSVIPEGSGEPQIRRAFMVLNNALAKLSVVDWWYEIDDRSGVAIATGPKVEYRWPFACILTAVHALADQIGSIQIDAWVTGWANYPPTNANSICGSNPLTISNTNKAEDVALSGWTPVIDAGDTMVLNVDSCTTIERCCYLLSVERR